MANRTSNATDSKSSRYVNGGTTDRYPNRLGWWERRPLEHSDDDIRFTIDKTSEARPDIIAFQVYGKALYYWVVLQYNNIVDIQEELTAGTEIRLPRYTRLILSIMNKKTGGNPVE